MSGWLATLILNGTLGLGAYAVARYGLRQAAGLPRTLATAVLAWAWATVGMELLGSLGGFAFGPLLAWSALGLGIGVVARIARGREPGEAVGRRDSDETWRWPATVALGLALASVVMLGGRALLGPVKVVSDGPIYHLYFAARWWKAGRLFLVAAPFGENAATYFPAVGELGFGWLMVGWGSERLAKVGQAPFLLLAALAAYGAARRLGVGRSAAVVATCGFVTCTPLLLFSFEPNVDTIFVAGYLTASYFFLRYALDDAGPDALALGALAAGGAWGTKPTSTVFVPVLVGLMALYVLARGMTWRRTVGHLALLLILPLAMAGYWFGRNLWLTGNPLYPLQVSAFGRVWLTGWYGPDVMRNSQFYLPFADWRALVDILVMLFDPRLVPLLLAALLGAWRIGRPRSPLDRWVWAASALAVLNLALYWIFIPYRTQQRFAFLAPGLLVVPLGRLLDRDRRLLALGSLLIAVHVLTPQGWPFGDTDPEIPWDLHRVVPNAIPAILPVLTEARSLLQPATTRGGATPLALLGVRWLFSILLVAASLAVAWSWGRLSRRRSASRLLTATAATTALAVGWAGGLALRDDDRLSDFFPPFPEYYNGWLALDAYSGRDGTRIAYAGTNIPYYLLGPGLRNEVRYINIDSNRDWLLHDYHRRSILRGRPNWPDYPRPGWDRQHPDYDAWLSNLRAAGIRLLVVTRANPAEGPQNIADADGFPIERQWAESHPETFAPLYGVAERDPEFRLYRLLPERGAARGPESRRNARHHATDAVSTLGAGRERGPFRKRPSQV